MKRSYFLVAAALVSMQLCAKDYYVKVGGNGDGESWTTAIDLQGAISKAVDQDVIHIAAGTYTPTVLPDDNVSDPRSATFAITANITLIGGYPENATEGTQPDATVNETILSGNDNFYHVLCVSTKSSGSVEKVILRGISLSNGRAVMDAPEEGTTPEPADRVTINGGAFLFKRGAAFISYNSNVELDNCVIKNCTGETSGSCVYIHKEADAGEGNVILKDCIIDSNNSNHSIAYIWGSSKVTVEGCEFSGNVSTAETAGIGFGGKAVVAVADCKFINNKAKNGGAMLIRDSEATVKKTTFQKNVATDASGAVVVENSGVIFSDCVMSENQSYTGGAVGVLKAAVVTFNDCILEKGNINDPKLTEQTTTSSPYYKASAVQVAGEGSIANFNDCTIAENFTRSDGAVCAKDKGKVYFKNCLFAGNKSIVESAVVRVDGEAAYGFFDGCTIEDNTLLTQVSGRYNAQHVMATASGVVDVYNSLFKGNVSQGKNGPSVGVRSAAQANIVNSTFLGNSGNDVIFVWDADSKANVISCTVVDNEGMGDGAICVHANAMAVSYNTIYSKNLKNGNESLPGGTKKYCILGDKYVDSEGADIVGVLGFDRGYDLSEELADNGGSVMTLKLDPDDEGATLALVNGMNAEELGTLATTLGLDVEKVKCDARGVARAGRNMGAYTVGQVVGMENVTTQDKTLKAYVENNAVCVNASHAMTVQVYTISGVRILTKKVSEGITVLPEISAKGGYILSAEGNAVKVIL
ncbi:right-handed parallel beta-helix repeat-containing protein [Bacteroides sp.]